MARERGTGSIYQQKGSDVFWIKYYKNGKAFRESSRSKDRKDATDLLRKRLAEITTGHFSNPKVERIKVEEFAEDFLRDYRVNGRKSLDDVQARWDLHLKPFLGHFRAVEVSSDLLSRYVDRRQQEDAANATINRELAALKRMFYLGYRATPPKVNRVPSFPVLREDNARTGFLEDGQYQKLIAHSPGLWFRALVEIGRTYGWRIGELLNLKVAQVDLLGHTLRLEPGTTKNCEGREVTMTKTVFELLKQCSHGKSGDDYVFTREDSSRVKYFRRTWKTVTKKAGVPNLLFHDLRRTAARNLRRAGVAEGVIMKIGGWRTRSVFERYAIVAQSDIVDAMKRLELQSGHDLGHDDSKPEQKEQQTSRPN
jgi:integrase